MSDELKKMIHNAFADEEKDIAKYNELIEAAEKEECFEAVRVLKDIRHDEQMHHKYLVELLA